jgi:hypothetical protein
MAEERFARFEGGPDPTPTDPAGAIPTAPDWVQQIPEQYRENPSSYFEHVGELEKRAQEAEQWREYGTRADAWIQWAQPQLGERQAQPQGQIPTREPQRSGYTPPPNPLQNVDWDDPQALPTVLSQMWQTMQERDREHYNRYELTAQEIEQRSTAFRDLLGYYDRINRLDRDGLYSHVQYQPPVNRERIAEYMQQHPGIQPEQAYQALTEESRIEAARRAGIEEGQRMATREDNNSRTTTETTRGTPPRRAPVQQNPHRGYGTRPQALYDAIATRTGRSDW